MYYAAYKIYEYFERIKLVYSTCMYTYFIGKEIFRWINTHKRLEDLELSEWESL